MSAVMMQLGGQLVPVEFADCGFCGLTVTVLRLGREYYLCDSVSTSREEDGPPLRLTAHACGVESALFPVPFGDDVRGDDDGRGDVAAGPMSN